jgi:hypothetical protein
MNGKFWKELITYFPSSRLAEWVGYIADDPRQPFGAVETHSNILFPNKSAT